MTARELLVGLLSGKWDLDLPIYVESGPGRRHCFSDDEYLMFGLRIERDRVVVGYDPSEAYVPDDANEP